MGCDPWGVVGVAGVPGLCRDLVEGGGGEMVKSALNVGAVKTIASDTPYNCDNQG